MLGFNMMINNKKAVDSKVSPNYYPENSSKLLRDFETSNFD